MRNGSLLASAVVGRTAELDALRAGWDGARAGRGTTIVLVGEAGIGKTRLLQEVRDRCTADGGAALVGRAVETATTLPFRALTEALLGACRTGPLADDPDVAPFRHALARLAPDPGGPVAEAAPLLHVAEGFLRVARSRGRGGRGTAVLLDDLQWADAETLAVVEYLADNVRNEPVLLVATARAEAARADTADTDTDGPVAGLSTLADRRVATLLPLHRLGAEDTAAMARDCLGDAAVPAQVLHLLAERADGLPFLVEELLAGLRSDGALVRDGCGWAVRRAPGGRPPATFRASVGSRVRLLAPEHRRILHDAALLGRTIDPALLETVAGADATTVAAALDAARPVTLLEASEHGMRFRHALTRDALLADLPAAERPARSRAALAAVRTARPDLPGELVEVAADLAEAAGDPASAVDLLLESARRAVAHGALTSAESAQRRAAALAGSGLSWWAARTALVTTLGLSGRVADAAPLGAALLDRLRSADPAGLPDDPDGAQLAVHLAVARAAAAATDWRLVADHLARARRLAPAKRPATAARLDALAAAVALGEYRLDDAARLAASAVAAAERADDADLLCEALLVHGRSVRTRRLGHAIRVFRRAADLAAAAGLQHREARALTELGFVVGSRDGDAAVLRTARARARACGAPETEAVAENALAGVAWIRADVAAVVRHTDAGLELARRYRLGQLEPALLVCQAAGLALRADVTAVEALLARAEALGSEPMERIAALAQARATAAFARDDRPAAARLLAETAALARVGATTAVVPMLALHPLVRAVDGDDPPPVEEELRRWNSGASRIVGGVLAAAGAVRAGRAGASAGTTADRALADLDVAPFLQAVVARLTATAAAADGWGDPGRWLAAAEATFTHLAMTAPAAGCAAQRRRLGPHRSAPVPGSALTPREEEVLALVADGLPNRVIADQLFLSARTVEKHVERLLTKTGRANRAQLATYARARPVEEPITWPVT